MASWAVELYSGAAEPSAMCEARISFIIPSFSRPRYWATSPVGSSMRFAVL